MFPAISSYPKPQLRRDLRSWHFHPSSWRRDDAKNQWGRCPPARRLTDTCSLDPHVPKLRRQVLQLGKTETGKTILKEPEVDSNPLPQQVDIGLAEV